MFHKVASMYRYLKRQDTLQSSLVIQNLNSTASFSLPHLYPPIELSLPAELQVVLHDLQDIRPRPLQVWNCDEIRFYPNGNCNNMVCTYNSFTGDRLWRTNTGDRAPFWCTALIFIHAGGQCFVPPVVVHQRTRYSEDLHYNTSRDWAIHNLPSGYMDRGSWHKSMSHFSFVCFYFPLNTQVLLYYGHDSHFGGRVLEILRRHNIYYFILKAGYSVHDQPNDNGKNMKLNNLYGNAIMNWMIHHVTLKFTSSQMNYVLVETWEAFKISSATITHKAFKNTHILPLSPPYIGFNHQACLDGSQQSNRYIVDDIGRIEKESITPINMEEFRTTDPIIILREKGRCRASRNLFISPSVYDTVRSPTTQTS